MNISKLKEVIIKSSLNQEETIEAHGNGSIFADIRDFRSLFFAVAIRRDNIIGREQMFDMFADEMVDRSLPLKYKLDNFDIERNQFRTPLFQKRAMSIQLRLKNRVKKNFLDRLTEEQKLSLNIVYDSVYKL